MSTHFEVLVGIHEQSFSKDSNSVVVVVVDFIVV